MKLIYVVLASIALVSAETPGILNDLVTGQLITINIRKIMEDLTPSVSRLIIENHLDPYALETIQTEFWLPFPSIPSISYKTHLSLYSGELKGLSYLKFNDATLTYESRTIKLAINIEFSLLTIAYNYEMKLRILNPQGIITADAKAVHASTIITFNTTDYTLAFDEFRLQSLNIENVVIEDQIGQKYWIISSLADILAILCKGRITKDVQSNVAEAIQGELSDINQNTPPEVLAQFFQNILLECGLDGLTGTDIVPTPIC